MLTTDNCITFSLQDYYIQIKINSYKVIYFNTFLQISILKMFLLLGYCLRNKLLY